MTTLDEDARLKAVTNERAKLTATFFNGLAVGVFVVGAVGPLLTYVFASRSAQPPLLLIIGIAGTCLVASGSLHFVARKSLGGLKP